MKPMIFLGQEFATDEDFKRAFPAYATYFYLVRKGFDTPQKIEQELFRKSQGMKQGQARYGVVRKKRA